MARAILTKVTAKGNYGTAGVAVTMAAAIVADKEEVALGSHDLIIAHNSGAAPHSVTITSVADPQFGRTGDITKSLAAGEIAVFGPFTGPGWRQANGSLYFEADHVDVKFGIVAIP